MRMHAIYSGSIATVQLAIYMKYLVLGLPSDCLSLLVQKLLRLQTQQGSSS